jgi:hypothetical protein
MASVNYVNYDPSTFGNVNTLDSKHLTVSSADDDSMSFKARSYTEGREPYSVKLTRRGNLFEFASDYSVADTEQLLKGCEGPLSDMQQEIISQATEALQRFQYGEMRKKQAIEQRAKNTRETVCHQVFEASRGLTVKETLSSDELEAYRLIWKHDSRAGDHISTDQMKRLAQAVISCRVRLTDKKVQMLHEMVRDEKAKGKTA